MIDGLLRAVARRVVPFALIGALAAGVMPAAAAPGTYAQLHAFRGLEGQDPVSTVLRGSDGVYYGTTSVGGPSHGGTIFRMTSDGTVTRMFAFDVTTNGAQPMDGLVEGPDGRLYGTASVGGPGVGGLVFAITKQGAFTILHTFSTGDGGTHPFNPMGAPVFGPDGALYGTTAQGGSVGGGTVWRLALDGTFSILWDLTQGNGPIGPNARLAVGSDGLLYGTSQYGGNDIGTVFRLAPDGSARRVLHAFTTDGDGAHPMSPVVEGADGKLYGTTSNGGIVDDPQHLGSGTVFSVSRGGANYRQLVRFSLALGDPIYPRGGLVESTRAGVFYGSGEAGGARGGGALFRMRGTDGQYQAVYAFETIDADGVDPRATLTLDLDGSFLGTTYGGGLGQGTVFRWTPR
jgi:uncharacterized repeat protein (TIGR03803 family)